MDTAFPATVRHLRERLADAAIDDASFERPLARCDLAVCGGTCCAQGASLNPEEALVVRQLTRRHRARFEAWLLDLPDEPVVNDDGAARTAVTPRAMHGRIAGHPPHFPDTACAYFDADARCALQRLAEAEGRHPWAYEPLARWLHPIALAPDRISLPDAATDPYPGGFASATHCGRTCPAGRPAREVLAPELEHLATMLGDGTSSAD